MKYYLTLTFVKIKQLSWFHFMLFTQNSITCYRILTIYSCLLLFSCLLYYYIFQLESFCNHLIYIYKSAPSKSLYFLFSLYCSSQLWLYQLWLARCQVKLKIQVKIYFKFRVQCSNTNQLEDGASTCSLLNVTQSV